jgi:hypothetical protein
MNLADNPYALQNNEAEIAFDVDLGIRDVLSKRAGFSESGLSATVESQTKLPQLAESIPVSGATIPWTGLTNIKLSDNSNTDASNSGLVKAESSEWLAARKYGFLLPAGAVPVGVTFGVERYAVWDSRFTQPEETDLRIAKNAKTVSGLSTTNFAANRKVPAYSGVVATPDTLSVDGSKESLAGLTLSKTEVESENFGINLAIRTLLSGGGEGLFWDVHVDTIPVTVYYLIPGAGTDVITHMRPWYTGSNRYLIISANGKIKRLKEGTVTSLFSGTAGSTWDFEQMEINEGGTYRDAMWALNGTDTPRAITTEGVVSEWKGVAKKIPNGTMLRTWKSRMIISGVAKFPQRLFYSEPFNPLAPDDETNGGYGTNYVDIGTGEDDIDPITWIEILDDVLLVFKKKSTWAIYEQEKFSNYKIANVGCEGRFMSCVLDDRCYFANRFGVYSVTAEGSPRYESLNLEPAFKGVGPVDLDVIDLEKLGTVGRMCALPTGTIHVAVSRLGDNNANRWLLKGYPRLRGASKRGDERTPWVRDEFAKRRVRAVAAYRSNDKEVDKIVAGLTDTSGTNPELVSLFTGTRDGLEPITWRWRSGRKAEISEEPLERVRRVNLLMKGRVQARHIVDNEEKTPVTLESVKEEIKRYRPETRGRYHGIELFEVGQEPFSCYAVEFSFRGGKEHTK